MADYVIHYADGQTATVPIYSEISVDNYKQEQMPILTPPKAISGAQVAWIRPYTTKVQEGLKTLEKPTPFSAVAYSMQWNNPRPNVAIQSVDLVSGPDRGRGVPVLLAMTAATAR